MKEMWVPMVLTITGSPILQVQLDWKCPPWVENESRQVEVPLVDPSIFIERFLALKKAILSTRNIAPFRQSPPKNSHDTKQPTMNEDVFPIEHGGFSSLSC